MFFKLVLVASTFYIQSFFLFQNFSFLDLVSLLVTFFLVCYEIVLFSYVCCFTLPLQFEPRCQW